MADNIFRSYRRPRSACARPGRSAAREGAVDPLAELARLIGQSDPQGGLGRDDGTEALDDTAPASELGLGGGR